MNANTFNTKHDDNSVVSSSKMVVMNLNWKRIWSFPHRCPARKMTKTRVKVRWWPRSRKYLYWKMLGQRGQTSGEIQQLAQHETQSKRKVCWTGKGYHKNWTNSTTKRRLLLMLSINHWTARLARPNKRLGYFLFKSIFSCRVVLVGLFNGWQIALAAVKKEVEEIVVMLLCELQDEFERWYRASRKGEGMTKET